MLSPATIILQFSLLECLSFLIFLKTSFKPSTLSSYSTFFEKCSLTSWGRKDTSALWLFCLFPTVTFILQYHPTHYFPSTLCYFMHHAFACSMIVPPSRIKCPLLVLTWLYLCSLSHVRLCVPMDCSLLGSSVHGVFQTRILGLGCYFLLQEIFLIQGSNLCLL